MASKSAQELATIAKDALRSAVHNHYLATKNRTDTITGKKHYATYERQLEKCISAIDALKMLAE